MVVTFTVYNTIELKNKILSYGANAEVISPKEHRDEIKEIVINTNKLYQ
jgi:predicted DNA-binding transcriptional regulator YafY